MYGFGSRAENERIAPGALNRFENILSRRGVISAMQWSQYESGPGCLNECHNDWLSGADWGRGLIKTHERTAGSLRHELVCPHNSKMSSYKGESDHDPRRPNMSEIFTNSILICMSEILIYTSCFLVCNQDCVFIRWVLARTLATLHVPYEYKLRIYNNGKKI